MSEGKRRAAARPAARVRSANGRFVAKAIAFGHQDGGATAKLQADAAGETKAGGAAGRAIVPAAKASSAGAGKARASQRPIVPWSNEREAIFLETLGRTCSVRNATLASGLSSGSIYRRRDASDTFRAAWTAAVREAYVRLETELLGRALKGVRKPVFHAGRRVGSVREYSDRLALALLERYREPCRGNAPAASPQAEARIKLIEDLSRMNRGMGGKG